MATGELNLMDDFIKAEGEFSKAERAAQSGSKFVETGIKDGKAFEALVEIMGTRSVANKLELTEDVSMAARGAKDIAKGLNQDLGLATDAKKFAKDVGAAESVAAEAEKQGHWVSRLGRKVVGFGWESTKFAGRHKTAIGLIGGVGGAWYGVDHYLLPAYDDVKRSCNCTCQGFNKLNLNDEKWDQLNKILYCRDSEGASCLLVDGECPTSAGCTIKTGNNKKTGSLYGATDQSNNFQSTSPQYKDWDGKTDNIFCPLENDLAFEDDFLNYHLHRATELAEVGAVAGGALTAQVGSGMLAASGGAAAAVAAGEFIPSDFPGHCLYRLFDSSEYTDPSSDTPTRETHQDLKVSRCVNPDDGAAGAPEGVRQKCSLRDGEEGHILEDNQGYTNRELGTCVAWNKSGDGGGDGGGGGKCKGIVHVPSGVFSGLWDLAAHATYDDEEDIDCEVLTDEGTCVDSEYCYWHNESNFDDIYLCLNDVTLIKMHNDIVDGGGDTNLISSKDEIAMTSKAKIIGDSSRVTELEKYNDKETDINDICNNYCTNGLCNNPAITTMPAVPGVEASVEGLKIIIKYSVLVGVTLLLWNNIVSEFFKQETGSVNIRVGFFNAKKLLSGLALTMMLLSVYYYGDKISEIIKLDKIISEKIIPFINDNIL